MRAPTIDRDEAITPQTCEEIKTFKRRRPPGPDRGDPGTQNGRRSSPGRFSARATQHGGEKMGCHLEKSAGGRRS